jgi:hypothetical protein
MIVSGPEQRRRRVMKSGMQKTESRELTDAELNRVSGGSQQGTYHEGPLKDAIIIGAVRGIIASVTSQALNNK